MTRFWKATKQQDKDVKAICKHREEVFSAYPKNGTSHLIRYSSRCSKEVNRDIRQFMLSIEVSSDGTSSIKSYKFDQEAVHRAIPVMVIDGEHPFTTVEEWGL